MTTMIFFLIIYITKRRKCHDFILMFYKDARGTREIDSFASTCGMGDIKQITLDSPNCNRFKS